MKLADQILESVAKIEEGAQDSFPAMKDAINQLAIKAKRSGVDIEVYQEGSRLTAVASIEFTNDTPLGALLRMSRAVESANMFVGDAAQVAKQFGLRADPQFLTKQSVAGGDYSEGPSNLLAQVTIY